MRQHKSLLTNVRPSSNTEHHVSVALDMQRLADSQAEFLPTTSQSVVGAMYHGRKEPQKLLFFKGGQYVATINGGGFNQLQFLLVDKVPSMSAVHKNANIPLLATPPGTNYIGVESGVPQQSELIERR